jgi:hypothetical protein
MTLFTWTKRALRNTNLPLSGNWLMASGNTKGKYNKALHLIAIPPVNDRPRRKQPDGCFRPRSDVEPVECFAQLTVRPPGPNPHGRDGVRGTEIYNVLDLRSRGSLSNSQSTVKRHRPGLIESGDMNPRRGRQCEGRLAVPQVRTGLVEEKS